MKKLAISLCRVSTPEQRLSNSLNRQEKSVQQAAKDLRVTIIETISGDISSKVGKNFNRPDLNKAFEICKNNRAVKFLIVDEVDRFMRSVGEMFYWITKFKEEAGVTVYFASNPELNANDARSRLLLSLDGYKAEGSNEERQRKSINGHVQALKEGRYTFPPKPGYMKGNNPGVHIPHPQTFKPLQKALKEVSDHRYTPTQALQRLNSGEFGRHYMKFNMDKFRRFATDPYYSGVLNIDKQVKVLDSPGLHEPMITKTEHKELIKIFNGSYKTRGYQKQYNPEFPVSKLVRCEECNHLFTGHRKNNGKIRNKTKYYYKYYCRGCKREYDRDIVHKQLTALLGSLKLDKETRKELSKVLKQVYLQRQKDKLKSVENLETQMVRKEETKRQLVRRLANTPENLIDELESQISELKTEIESLEQQIDRLSDFDKDMAQFIDFALDYSNNLHARWWQLDYEDRARCQNLMFPGGILFNSQKKVGTQNISPIYRLEPTKKDLRIDRKSLMVELQGIAPWSVGLSKSDLYRLSLFIYLGIFIKTDKRE